MIIQIEVEGLRLSIAENESKTGFVISANKTGVMEFDDSVLIGTVRRSETDGYINLYTDEEE